MQEGHDADGNGCEAANQRWVECAADVPCYALQERRGSAHGVVGGVPDLAQQRRRLIGRAAAGLAFKRVA